ncbi:uncharacterized protein LOC125683133 isoform X2 [Ostrea edulis]|nr:uncharacterized protein LOC125683133 isoform X2 [Ostrea edulis]
MNFRKVVLVYIVIFAWFAVYRLVFGQTEITYYAGPRLTVGPMGETYYGPMIPYGSGNSDLAGIGVIGLLLYTVMKILGPIIFIGLVGSSLSN